MTTADNRYTKAKRINSQTIVSSRPFKRGVTDFREGRWSEIFGTWRGVDIAIVYELGRLTAASAAAHGEGITVSVFNRAVTSGEIRLGR